MFVTGLALRCPVTTVAATAALVLLGAVSLGGLPVSLPPNVALPGLTIRTACSGAHAPELSHFVAEPVHEAISSTHGPIEARSVNRTGWPTTLARFAWGTDITTAVLNGRERLDDDCGRHPERAERPIFLIGDPGERSIAILAIRHPASDNLRSLARTARAYGTP